MRIGIDVRLWNETGVGRYIRNLVEYLQVLDRENDYVLFVRSKDKEGIRNQESGIRKNHRWKIVEADVHWHTLREQWEMPKILARENLDLVHFPYFNVPIFYRGPFIVTIHDLIINHFPTGRATTLPWPLYQIKRLGYQFVLGQALKKAQKIIAVSESTKKEIIDHFAVDPGKIMVTYESGELDIEGNQESRRRPASPKLQRGERGSPLAAGIRPRPEARPEGNQEIRRPYLLYVGNAHPHKNLERLLEAFKTIKHRSKETIKKLKLVLVGRDDYFYQRLKERLKEIRLENEVILYGEVTDLKLFWLYKNAQALILPSLMEGFGLPALEAMSLGCLVLASDIPAFREICGEAAIYFNPHNVGDITEVLGQVIHYDTAQYHSKIKKGLERAKIFSWQKTAEETLKIYKEAI